MPLFKKTETRCLVCQTDYKLETKRCPHCFVSVGKHMLESLETPEAADIPREVPRSYDGYPIARRNAYEKDVAVMGRAGWTATGKKEQSDTSMGHISIMYVPDTERLRQQRVVSGGPTQDPGIVPQ